MNNTPVILVTGANGQLGSELRDIAKDYPQYHFIFKSREELSIREPAAVKAFFNANQINFCINCAAYTDVDKAPTEAWKVLMINGAYVGDLAGICKENNCQLIHISTDYVFDGTASVPYTETVATNPVNTYGKSKLLGEQKALEYDPSTIIIRTSWLYSSYGRNFVKTMLRLMKERESVNVVNDQYGSPTYAADLASVIMTVIGQVMNGPWSAQHGQHIFHYCNSGVISWYEFAMAIKEITGSKCLLNAITAAEYGSSVQRPAWSVLDTTLIQQTFHIAIPGWRESLEKCLKKIPA